MEFSRIPRRSKPVAIVCFSGNRLSNRYTRIFVPTRAATAVKIVSCSASASSWPFPGAWPAAVSFSGLIEEPDGRCRICSGCLATRGHYPNRIACRNPLDFITRADTIAIRHRFRHGDLKLRCDLRHWALTCKKDDIHVCIWRRRPNSSDHPLRPLLQLAVRSTPSSCAFVGSNPPDRKSSAEPVDVAG
jgi:hypothetical protein